MRTRYTSIDNQVRTNMEALELAAFVLIFFSGFVTGYCVKGVRELNREAKKLRGQ